MSVTEQYALFPAILSPSGTLHADARLADDDATPKLVFGQQRKAKTSLQTSDVTGCWVRHFLYVCVFPPADSTYANELRSGMIRGKLRECSL